MVPNRVTHHKYSTAKKNLNPILLQGNAIYLYCPRKSKAQIKVIKVPYTIVLKIIWVFTRAISTCKYG